MPQKVAKKTHGNTLNNKDHTNSKRSAENKVPVSTATNFLNKAEINLIRAQAALEKATIRVAIKREMAIAVSEKAKRNKHAASVNAAKRTKDIVVLARLQQQKAASIVKTARESLRDAKQRVKREQHERQLLARKENARQKAVAGFFKKWNHEWDKKMKKYHKTLSHGASSLSSKNNSGSSMQWITAVKKFSLISWMRVKIRSFLN